MRVRLLLWLFFLFSSTSPNQSRRTTRDLFRRGQCRHTHNCAGRCLICFDCAEMENQFPCRRRRRRLTVMRRNVDTENIFPIFPLKVKENKIRKKRRLCRIVREFFLRFGFTIIGWLPPRLLNVVPPCWQQQQQQRNETFDKRIWYIPAAAAVATVGSETFFSLLLINQTRRIQREKKE